MASAELYLIRHGESEMNTSAHLIGGRSNETPLTTKGIEQASLLGQYLLRNNIMPDHVFASPALRTVQTARYALDAMNLDIQPTIVDEIQEMDQGDYVGRQRAEVYTPETLKQIEKHGKDFKLPGGESMNDTGNRMLEWLNRHVPTNDDERTFVFGHGMAIRTLASTIHDWSHTETYQSVTDNTSLSLFVHDGNKWQLHTLGATPHFDT